MPGPPPKHPAMRRRRNKVAGATTLSTEGPKGPPPPLPDRGCGDCGATGQVDRTRKCGACEGLGYTAQAGNRVPCQRCGGEGQLARESVCSSCGGTGVQPWHPLVVSWWVDIWSSPMANEYVESDKHGLFLLAELHDQFWKTGERELAGEIRLQEQRFGLSPMDRRRLQWQVLTTEERMRKGAKQPPRSAPLPPRASDPRKVLSMVGRGKRA